MSTNDGELSGGVERLRSCMALSVGSELGANLCLGAWRYGHATMPVTLRASSPQGRQLRELPRLHEVTGFPRLCLTPDEGWNGLSQRKNAKKCPTLSAGEIHTHARNNGSVNTVQTHLRNIQQLQDDDASEPMKRALECTGHQFQFHWDL